MFYVSKTTQKPPRRRQETNNKLANSQVTIQNTYSFDILKVEGAYRSNISPKKYITQIMYLQNQTYCYLLF